MLQSAPATNAMKSIWIKFWDTCLYVQQDELNMANCICFKFPEMFFTFAKKIQTFQEYFGFEDDLHLFWFGLIQILLIFWETKYTNPKDLILFI